MEGTIKNSGKVLFQGDSVTDAGRTYMEGVPLGLGYPYMISALLGAAHPEKELRFENRGVSGDRVVDLKRRWQKDCIDLRPDLLTILIGINDCWRKYDNNDPTTAEDFEDTYRQILTDAVDNTGAKLIVMEPFLLPVQKRQELWRDDLDPKIHAVRKLAREFRAILVPLDGIFARASTLREQTFWSADGVHPTPAGHALIARSWLKALRLEMI